MLAKLPALNGRLRWILAVTVGLGCLLVIVKLASGPLALYLLKRSAKERGFDLHASKTQLGFGGISLTNVQVRRAQAPTLEAQFDEVEIEFGPLSTHRAVEIVGGKIVATGTLASWQRFLGLSIAPAAAAPQAAASERWALSLKHVDARWSPAPRAQLELTQLGLSTAPGGVRTVTADSVSVNSPQFEATLRTVRATFDRKGHGRRLQSIDIVSAQAIVRDVSEPSAPAAPNAKGPALAGATNPSAPASATTPALSGVLRSLLDEVRERATQTLGESARLEVAKLSVSLHGGPHVLNFGPEKLSLRRTPEGLAFRAEPGAQLVRGSTPVTLDVKLPLKPAEPVRVAIEGGPMTLAEFGLRTGDLGIERPERTTLQASVQMVLNPDASAIVFTGNGSLSNLSLRHASLSAQPLEDLQVGLRAKGDFDLTNGSISLQEAELKLGALQFVAAGKLAKSANHWAIHAGLNVPLVACQAARYSLPTGLFPLLSGVALSGTLGLSARVDVDTQQLSESQVSWVLNNECRVDSIPPDLDPRRFREAFTHQVMGSRKEPLFFETGPGTANWVPLTEIATAMVTAVLVSEDGNFFEHRGFDQRALQKSVRDNLNAGKFLRGGSTISMQLAKNLYLKREKTLSRKLQEAFFTLLLEQELTKQEILELYLNVIEYGPDVYGLRQAALYYFGTVPAQLSYAQAFYLASILPDPKRNHFSADATLKPNWSGYVRTLLQIAHQRKRLSDSDLSLALSEELRFGKPTPLPE